MSYDVCPALPDVAQPYGCTPYTFEVYWPPCPSQRFHAGIDLWDSAAPDQQGQPVFATRSGVIADLGQDVPLENHDLGPYAVCLKTDEGPYLWYGHLSAAYVTDGQRVNVGDALGAIGTLGISTGPHLHFEARWDAQPATTDDVVTNSIDPTPYLTNAAPPPPPTPPSEDVMPRQTNIDTYPVLLAPGQKAYTTVRCNANEDPFYLTAVGCDQGDATVDLIWTNADTGAPVSSNSGTCKASGTLELPGLSGVLRGVIVNHGPGTILTGCKAETRT